MNILLNKELSINSASDANFIIELEGFEGPLHLLLELSRKQKVDLLTISLVDLADQYLGYISKAKSLNIELAADYLIMAAWLVYLKSELLIPSEDFDDEVTAEELSENLKFQLLKLDAMRKAAVSLISGDQLNRDFFSRGFEESETRIKKVKHKAALIDLIRAYAGIKTKEEFEPLHLQRPLILTPEEAFRIIKKQLSGLEGWKKLEDFSLEFWKKTTTRARSAKATNLAVFLELAKSGEVEIKQKQSFAPVLIRKTGNTQGVGENGYR